MSSEQEPAPDLFDEPRRDRLTNAPLAERMATGIAGAELVVIPDAGHLSNLEQPDRFTAAVERFAERLLLSRR